MDCNIRIEAESAAEFGAVPRFRGQRTRKIAIAPVIPAKTHRDVRARRYRNDVFYERSEYLLGSAVSDGREYRIVSILNFVTDAVSVTEFQSGDQRVPSCRKNRRTGWQ